MPIWLEKCITEWGFGRYGTWWDLVLVASQGFEPRLIGSEPTVLPLNEEATDWCGAADLLAFRLQIFADVQLF
jgi:hypothetical protein